MKQLSVLSIIVFALIGSSCTKKKGESMEAATALQSSRSVEVVQATKGPVTETYRGKYAHWHNSAKNDDNMEIFVEREARGTIIVYNRKPIQERWGDTIENSFLYKWQTKKPYYTSFDKRFERLEGVAIKFKNDSIFVRWYLNDEIFNKGTKETGGIHEIYAAWFEGKRVN